VAYVVTETGNSVHRLNGVAIINSVDGAPGATINMAIGYPPLALNFFAITGGTIDN
jgi:hypothetical protein